MELGKSTQTILLVEDDHNIRRAVKAFLELEGYIVLIAKDAEAALKLYDQAAVSLLLTDVIMPNTSGLELADQLLRREPQLRILFLSGSENVSRGLGWLAIPIHESRVDRQSRPGPGIAAN